MIVPVGVCVRARWWLAMIRYVCAPGGHFEWWQSVLATALGTLIGAVMIIIALYTVNWLLGKVGQGRWFM